MTHEFFHPKGNEAQISDAVNLIHECLNNCAVSILYY